jgi:hypothetical protein
VTGVLERLAEIHDVPVIGHRDAEHQYLLAVVAHGVTGRILEAARDGREISQLDDAAVSRDREVAEILLARELAADAHEHAVASRVDRARRQDAVLALEALDDRERRDAERGETLV